MLQPIRNYLAVLPRRQKRAYLVLFDVIVLAFSVHAAYALRYDSWALPSSLQEWLTILSAPLAAIPIFIQMGLYRAVVRYLPERAMWTILQAMTLSTLCWVLILVISEIGGRGELPRSVPFLYWALGTTLVAGCRFGAKVLFWPESMSARRNRPAVLIYGAGKAGTTLAHSLRSNYSIIGLLDDNASMHNRDVGGIRVYSPVSLPVLIRDYGISEVILSIPSLDSSRRKEIVALIGQYGLKVRSLPTMEELVSGKYNVSHIREIDLDDLLGRSSVPPDPNLIRTMIEGRSIMVTGAGGSIGSELCRLVAQWRPQKLVLFEANEYALYRIEQELGQSDGLAIVPILGSVTDMNRVNQALAGNGIDAVFHAAAHKHVPLVETNALEGIRNNVFGTKTIADAAFKNGVKNFVLISTDKAVRPTNVMGATKRWAELIVHAKAAEAARASTGQRFCAVRFGNVLGSNGSVVPLFKEQIARGGPITLTDPKMTRYFMSIHEAAELIVQAGAMSDGGDVFLLDMGEPILIKDLAENMVRLAGLRLRTTLHPRGDIEIVVTGKRPGEKMYEELFYDEDSAEQTVHQKIMRSKYEHFSSNAFDISLHELSELLAVQDETGCRRVLFKEIK